MQKQKYILPIAMLFTVMALVLVSAANPVLITPATDYNYTTSFVMNVTYVNETDITSPIGTNSTLECNYTGTWVKMTWTSFACTDAECTATVALTSAMDDTGITCNITLGNDTAGAEVSDAGGEEDIIFDSTKPVITVTTDFSEINLHRFTKYSTAISDATHGLDGTEACTITNPQGDVTSVSTSASINDDIWDDTGIPGVYNLSCSATDKTTNPNTVSTTFEVKTTGPPVERDGVSLGILEKIKGLDSRVWIIIAIIVVIVLATKKKS